MLGTIAIFAFLALDVGLVIGGLLWLSERRAYADKTDQRFRERRSRIRYR